MKKLELEEREIKIPDEVKGLVGEPPLVAGENEEAYNRLLDAVVKERNPQSVMDRIDVYDFVNKLWEEQRLSRAIAGLISGGLPKALKYFLEQTNQDPSNGQKYFSEDPIERQLFIQSLAPYGITPGTLQAKAADYHNVTLKTLERMRGCVKAGVASFVRRSVAASEKKTKMGNRSARNGHRKANQG
jgi:hypothetical protein